MKFLFLIPLFFSRTRKSILAMLLVVSSTAFALTPSPANQPDGQQPMPTTAQPIPSWPADSTTTDSKDNKFANEIEQLQQELALLKLKEQKVKLEDSIAKTTTEKTEGKAIDKATSRLTQDISDTEDVQISIRSIYGVGHLYRAVIDYQGAEITVNKGSDIDGHWKVVSINSSTVHIRNDKTGKKKILSLSAPQAKPAQASMASPPAMAMPPVIPFTLPTVTPDAMQTPAATPRL